MRIEQAISASTNLNTPNSRANQLKKRSRQQINKEEVLSKIASCISQLDKIPVDQLISNLRLLDDRVNYHKTDLLWAQISSELRIDRWRLYHWFFETFERSLQNQISSEDLVTMKTYVTSALSKGHVLDKQFQSFVKQKLTGKYHRSSFSIAFNNIKRQLVRAGVDDERKFVVSNHRPATVSPKRTIMMDLFPGTDVKQPKKDRVEQKNNDRYQGQLLEYLTKPKDDFMDFPAFDKFDDQ